MTKEKPVPPFKLQGKIDHVGWEIPTRYVIDFTGQCWKDDAHGGDVYKCTKEVLVDTAKEAGEHVQNKLRAVLGMPLVEPSWMQLARKNGWGPLK